MKIKYFLQKCIGNLFKSPIIPDGKTIGYSLVQSERSHTFLGKNTRVMPPYYLHNVQLGDYSYISKNSSISNCTIGRFCSIGPNFCCGLGIHPTMGVSTSPMFYSRNKQNGVSLCKENKIEEFKNTTIGNDVFIGVNVTVLDGICIGNGAIIGAGAVVTDDIPAYAIAVGVPARVIKFRFDDKTISELNKSEWWNGNADVLAKVERHFWSADDFLNDQ